MRWSTAGRGKRGGLRVVYYWRRTKSRIYLLTIYGKNVKDDLSAAERKALRQLVGEIENG